tara:strand:+ start:359 stop:712 length:354 start_codon:yes stop_codon:yes gene_type:complete
MEDLIDSDVVEVVVDFTGLDGSEEKLQELFGPGPYTIGNSIKTILGRMFGMNAVPVTIRGTESQVGAFAKALGAEKRYIETARSLGLTNPRTTMTKSQVQSAAKEFKRKTGIDWPFE